MKALPHLPMYLVESTPFDACCDASLLNMCFSVIHNIEVCGENRKRHWSLISLSARMEIGYLLFC